MQAAQNSRRSFLSTVTLGLCSIPVLGGLWLGLRTALAPVGRDRPLRLALCKPNDVPATGILERVVSYPMREGPAMTQVSKVVFLTRDPAKDGAIIVMSGECTHLSCPVQHRRVQMDAQATDQGPALLCPCHGGKFSATGEVLDGPPPAPLRRLRYQLDEGMLYLLDL